MIVEASFRRSPLWSHITVFNFTRNMRAALRMNGDGPELQAESHPS